ncbi:DUF445 domain-containing protein [Chitinophaga filiformis]|uniref:DUF445 domain-containing protein n=1 Tax=Chitinophaga filiformis TaxID=104663 RepID=A0ABY4HXJ9_CHIFI|nr:hypothetical protein [Chitinophaga filiformis]UPK68312.1 hypothetical protein MYF79_25480 [Chitinophaga filiformis]
MSLYIIPFLGALTGWLTNKITILFALRSLSRRQQQLADQTGEFVATKLFSFDEVRQQLADPEKIKSMIPVVEVHMDTFLREKLPEAMPVFKMFIGDSTIQQVKTVLVAELDNMFPEIIDQYLRQTEKELDVRAIVSRKISALSVDQLKKLITVSLRRELRLAEMGGAAIGFFIGLLQLWIALHHNN